MPVVDAALDVEGVQHLLLIGVRADVETREGQRDPVVLSLRPAASASASSSRSRSRSGSYGLEELVVPVGVERRRELVEQCRGRDARKADIPLHAVQQRGFGTGSTSRRTRCRSRCRAPEQPRLGVQAGAGGVVLDLDLGAEISTSRSSASRSVAPM